MNQIIKYYKIIFILTIINILKNKKKFQNNLKIYLSYKIFSYNRFFIYFFNLYLYIIKIYFKYKYKLILFSYFKIKIYYNSILLHINLFSKIYLEK